MNGTVADEGTAFGHLADCHLDDSYRRASAILRDPVEGQDALTTR